MLSVLFFSVLISNINTNYHEIKIQNFQDVQISRVESHSAQWVTNRFFSDDLSWISIKEGDESDVDAYISDGYGNYIIHGDSRQLQIDNPLSDADWELYRNPDLPILPNGLSTITESGCVVSHSWDENVNQTHNRPSAQWKRTINMPVNMSDYIITDASLEVYFNASVVVSPWWDGGIDREGDTGLDDYSTGDYSEFYVLFSDVEETFPPVRVAYNHTGDLGRDGTSGIYPDTPMDIVPKNVLKSILSSVLETDGFNFTITLGIDIYCEDNEIGVDIDTWNYLIIRNFNLTFSYEKKINQFTTISWEQTGNQITGENIQITDAQLNYELKINNTWPSSLSPNSEIRILINDKQYIETVKLSSVQVDVLELAYPVRKDLTSLISKDLDIILSIEIYLADEFELGEDIKISIDNVYFRIYWDLYVSDIFSEPFIFRVLLILSSIAALSIGGYLVAYQRVLKYPKPVRKVRKYRRTLTRKNEPTTNIVNREDAFKKEYKKTVHKTSSFLKGKPIEGSASIKSTTMQKEPSGIKHVPDGNKNL